MAPAIPDVVRNRLRNVPLARRVRDRLFARSYAGDAKRLDLVAAQVAQLLHMSGLKSVEGAVCLEVGSGWVLSHALVLHLLGARRVIATDVERVAHPAALRQAVRGSNESAVRDFLAPFTTHADARARVRRVRQMPSLDVEALAGLGIEYRAPVDLAKAPLGEPIDVVVSFSCLEHVPVDEVRPLIANLAADLRPGGTMLHEIHLEDHRDFASTPFAFLDEPAGTFGAQAQTSRGNRLRASQWLAAFESVPGLSPRVVYAWQRLDRPLPIRIDPAVEHTDERDLRTSHLALLVTKSA